MGHLGVLACAGKSRLILDQSWNIKFGSCEAIFWQ